MKYKSISDYSQPDFYHFSEDSIILAKTVADDLGYSGRHLRALDLCAGCGVVGLEIMQRHQNLEFDFCELQQEFEKHLLMNREMARVSSGEVWIGDFRSYISQSRYDIIVANPPYYDLERGRKPLDENKQVCKFFEEGFMDDLLRSAKKMLASGGVFYLITPHRINEGKRLWSNRVITIFKVCSPG